ncbi:ornithine cyclodeaminase family protein [Catellatospora sichuanensis]|uniref:ornithine cyclodeaminase family protein n=1 Tax=Catellatospora sichuanensis TaxID=1969805 RepID=UPI0011841DF1|nr:ornithine cyclodeaminase family protein [Catellatospora sichuanensis]
MNLMIERLREGLGRVHAEGRQLSPLRDGFVRTGPVPGIIEWMPHHDSGDSITIKTVAYSPANPDRFGLPTIVGTVARFDDVTGRLIALSDGVVLTAIRTGAVSAIASAALAHPDSRTVGLIGAGAQSITQLHGLTLTLPIETVLVWDTDPERLASFATRAAFLGLDVRCASPEEIAVGADVITTATSVGIGGGPVLPDRGLREHLHVNAVGSDLVGKTELPKSLLHRALVCPDHPEQALREGECQQLSRDQLGPALGALCADPASVAHARNSLTVFDSTGFALEDHIALDVFLEIATAIGAGTSVSLEYQPMDAVDPYSPHVELAEHAGKP